MKTCWTGEKRNLIGSRLHTLRLRHGLSQELLAAKLTLLGVDFNALTILRIEHGTRFVYDMELRVIAQFFKVTADELLGLPPLC